MTICEQIKFVMVITWPVDAVYRFAVRRCRASTITPQIPTLCKVQGICGICTTTIMRANALVWHGNCANSWAAITLSRYLNSSHFLTSTIRCVIEFPIEMGVLCRLVHRLYFVCWNTSIGIGSNIQTEWMVCISITNTCWHAGWRCMVQKTNEVESFFYEKQ